MPHHDLVIIGSGSGNSLLTMALADLDIALIDGGTFGGTCLNHGCIPTKMFVLPADRIVEASEGHRIGLYGPAPTLDWQAVRNRVFGRIDPISHAGEAFRAGQDKVTLYRDHARFTGERELTLDSGTVVTADRMVVAAGSRPFIPQIPGLAGPDPDQGVHTSDTIMRISNLPRRLAILGGGFVACEFAHVFSAFGVQVTQIQRSSELLRREEASIATAFTAAARARYDVRTRTAIASARRDDGVWHLDLDGPDRTALTVDAILLATGRVPNSDRLDVEAGGLQVHRDLRVVVDDQLRTSVEGVWALGDVSDEHQLKHVANLQARIVAHNLAVDLGLEPGPPQRLDNRPVPHAVFTNPQVASFGPTSADLAGSNTPYVTHTQAYGDTAYGWALEDTTGFMTVHASPDGRILAAHVLGPNASTLIQPLIQAATFGQHAHQVARDQYWIHPALAEVVENALLGLRFDAEADPDGAPTRV